MEERPFPLCLDSPLCGRFEVVLGAAVPHCDNSRNLTAGRRGQISTHGHMRPCVSKASGQILVKGSKTLDSSYRSHSIHKIIIPNVA